MDRYAYAPHGNGEFFDPNNVFFAGDASDGKAPEEGFYHPETQPQQQQQAFGPGADYHRWE